MISVSIIDYIGKIKNGVAILISLNVNDIIYELVFWFDKKFHYTLTVDEKLMKDLNLESIYDYPYINELIDLIFKELPPVNSIFKTYNI